MWELILKLNRLYIVALESRVNTARIVLIFLNLPSFQLHITSHITALDIIPPRNPSILTSTPGELILQVPEQLHPLNFNRSLFVRLDRREHNTNCRKPSLALQNNDHARKKQHQRLRAGN